MLVNPYAFGPAAPFDPSSLADLVYWLRGDLLVTGGDYSASLPNSAPGGSPATLNSGSGATVGSTLNSLNVATFAATGYTLATLPALNESSLFAVLNMAAATANQLFIGSTANSALLWYINASQQLSLVSEFVALVGNASASLVASTWYQLNVTYEGNTGSGDFDFRRDQAADGSGSHVCTIGTGTNILAWDGGASAPFDGMIAELILVNRVVTPTERSNVEAYFNAKWGV